MAAMTKKGEPIRKRSRLADPIQIATGYGIDVSLLIANISRNYTELIRQHQSTLNTAKKLWKAKHPRDKQAILELEAIKELKNPKRDPH
jgi:hypothetical protein